MKQIIQDLKSGKTILDEIIESQRNETLTEYIYETGNQKTYTGLVNSLEPITKGLFSP